jgi:hypothetical protein
MQIRTSLTGAALALLLLGGLTACAGGRTATIADPFENASEGPRVINLHVTNLNFNEARLWAISMEGRQRIGVIGGKADAVYRLPWNFSQPLRIEIDLLAGPRCTTEAIPVDPGDELRLQIEMDLARQARCN